MTVVRAWLLLAVACLPVVALADDQDTIDYRQHIMAAMGDQAAAIAQILQHKAPSDNFATHVQTLAVITATAKKAFEPKVPGGEAKRAVWENWADFAKRLDELTASTADLAKTATAGGLAAAAPKVEAALNCKGCHDIYGAPKKLSVLASAGDQSVIDYRQHVMNTLNAQTAALGQILSGAIPDDNVIAHLDAVALTAKTALKAFEPKVQGGEAKPEVWSNWSDFAKRMNEFVERSAAIAKMAKEQGKEAALPNILDALPCKACHDVYRNEKK